MKKTKPYFIDLSGKSKKEINLFLEALSKTEKGIVIKKKLAVAR
jgi:hypothetical protein